MNLLDSLRTRLGRLKQAVLPPSTVAEERMNFSLELPGPAGKPLWRLQVQMHSEPQGDGEKLRLRAHIQTNLASALRPALDAPVADRRALTLAGQAGKTATSLARRALRSPALRALAEPLLQHDLNTWVEIHSSSAHLENGARELLPQGERLAAMGIAPRRKEGPVTESWAGEAAGGFAQVSLIQLDKQHLPQALQDALGSKPFQFAAAVVNTLEAAKP